MKCIKGASNNGNSSLSNIAKILGSSHNQSRNNSKKLLEKYMQPTHNNSANFGNGASMFGGKKVQQGQQGQGQPMFTYNIQQQHLRTTSQTSLHSATGGE